MDDRFNEVIAKPIKRNASAKVVLWLNLKDLLFIGLSFVFFAPIWIPLLAVNEMLGALITIVIIALIDFFCVLDLGYGDRVYNHFIYLFKFLFAKKQVIKKELKYIDNVLVLETTDKKHKKRYCKSFIINGKDISLLEYEERRVVYDKLAVLYYLQNDDQYFELAKIKSKFEINKLDLKNKVEFINSIIDNENNLIDEFQNCDTKENFLINIFASNKEKLNSFINDINDIINGLGINLIELKQDDKDNVLNQLFFSNKKIDIYKDYFIIDKKYYAINAVTNIPLVVNTEWQEHLFNLIQGEVLIKYAPHDSTTSKKLLDKAVANAKHECSRHKRNQTEREYDFLVYDSLSQQIPKIVSGENKLISTSIYYIVSADSKKELYEAIKLNKNKLLTVDVKIDKLLFRQLDAIKTISTLEAIVNKTTSIEILSSTLGLGFPLKEEFINDSLCPVFARNDQNYPILIDWSKKDKTKNMSNAVFVGKSGSGKTTACLKMIRGQMATNKYKCYAIDPEGDYINLFKNAGGQVLGGKECKINMFYFKAYNLTKNGIKIEKTIADHLQLLESIFNILFPNLMNNAFYKTKIIEALDALYSKKEFKLNDGEYEFTFTDFYKYLESKNKGADWLDQIHVYCANKPYGSMFDYKNDFNVENDYVCFDFKDVTGNFQTDINQIKLLLLLNFMEEKIIQNMLSDNKKYISVVVDEGHLFTNSNDASLIKFFDRWVRRIRKYNGMISYVTQNLMDLQNDNEYKKYTKSILNNSHYKFVFNIENEDRNILNELLKDSGGLTQQEKTYIANCRDGRGLMIEHTRRQKIQVIMNW